MIEFAPASAFRRLPWNDAMMYCMFLSINGKVCWRLPTYRELETCKNFTAPGLEYGKYIWTSDLKNPTNDVPFRDEVRCSVRRTSKRILWVSELQSQRLVVYPVRTVVDN